MCDANTCGQQRPARTYLWSFAAGILSVVALAGYWIVLFRLVKMPPNALPDVSSYPRMTVALMILMGSLVAPFMEEAGFRGYFQVGSFAVRSRSPSPPSGLPSRTSLMASCGQSFWCTFLWASPLARRRISPTLRFRLLCPT